MSTLDEQQFCLRWNNFQANFTSQFETLRDDEDFTDVTIACEGQKLKAHKVVLSACSPFFKDLFKTNPCSHPIIFMKDVEAQHIVALMEFMYAGEVNVAQAHLSSFLKTAESLKIRGLTDTSSDLNIPKECSNQNSSKINAKLKSNKNASWSTVTSSQDESKECSPCSTPPSKKQCTSDSEFSRLKSIKEEPNVGINSNSKESSNSIKPSIELKMELPDYLSEEEEIIEATDVDGQFFAGPELGNLPGGMEIIPKNNHFNFKGVTHESTLQNTDSRKLHSLDPRPCEECGRVYSNLSNLRQHMKLIHYPTYVKCTICCKSFKTDLYLRRHMIGSHGSTVQRNYIESKTGVLIGQQQVEPRFSQ